MYSQINFNLQAFFQELNIFFTAKNNGQHPAGRYFHLCQWYL
jgi:hypothetical protein